MPNRVIIHPLLFYFSFKCFVYPHHPSLYRILPEQTHTLTHVLALTDVKRSLLNTFGDKDGINKSECIGRCTHTHTDIHTQT